MLVVGLVEARAWEGGSGCSSLASSKRRPGKEEAAALVSSMRGPGRDKAFARRLNCRRANLGERKRLFVAVLVEAPARERGAEEARHRCSQSCQNPDRGDSSSKKDKSRGSVPLVAFLVEAPAVAT